ncbi:MAG: putative salt-induced outer membrane protein [Rickettsiales bacterium]|jgi:putative salt-induced outer membrane protein
MACNQTSFAEIGKDYLPSSIKKSLLAACISKDSFVINAVRDSAIKTYPKLQSTIGNYLASDCTKDAKKETEKRIEKIKSEKSVPAKNKEEKKPWNSSVDLGISIATGNTEQENINANFTSNYDAKKWNTNLRMLAINQKEGDNRTAEQYRALVNSRYKLKTKNYFFGEAEYVKDRFSGYDYRISESLGYGRVFVKNSLTTLEAEASAGMRQSLITSGEKSNSLMQKTTVRFNHKLTAYITFSEQLSVSIDQEAIISESETSIKTKLKDNLYLNFSVNIENISEVPEGTKNTDTLSTLSLGYSF